MLMIIVRPGAQASVAGEFMYLDLSDEERAIVEEFADDSVEPLKSICERWFAAVERKGRIPW